MTDSEYGAAILAIGILWGLRLAGILSANGLLVILTGVFIALLIYDWRQKS